MKKKGGACVCKVAKKVYEKGKRNKNGYEATIYITIVLILINKQNLFIEVLYKVLNCIWLIIVIIVVKNYTEKDIFNAFDIHTMVIIHWSLLRLCE